MATLTLPLPAAAEMSVLREGQHVAKAECGSCTVDEPLKRGAAGSWQHAGLPDSSSGCWHDVSRCALLPPHRLLLAPPPPLPASLVGDDVWGGPMTHHATVHAQRALQGA